MNTLQLIKSLTDANTSHHIALESLYTLTKHNSFKDISEELKICYFNEQLQEARQLIQIELDKQDIEPKQGKTIYTLRNKSAKQRSDSKQTIGYMMTLCGNDKGYLYALDVMARLNCINELESNPLFINRHNRYKLLLKRKARLSKVKTSKKGKATYYHKRVVPTPPSKQA